MVTLVKNFISLEEQKNLTIWASEEESKLKPNLISSIIWGVYTSPNRFNNRIENLSENKIVFDIRERVIKKFNLQDFKQDPELGDWLGVTKDGGAVHLHTDKRVQEHHRFNVLVQLPKEGGKNIYNENVPRYFRKELPVEERMLIYYRPDLYHHGTTLVVGDRNRINLSFGFLKT